MTDPKPLTGRQIGAAKNRLNRVIAQYESVVRRWKSYAPDEYLTLAIEQTETKLTALRAERAQLDSHLEDSNAADHLR